MEGFREQQDHKTITRRTPKQVVEKRRERSQGKTASGEEAEFTWSK